MPSNLILNRFFLLAIFVVGAALMGRPQSADAGGGPESVLLVVNADDPSSLLIGNFYAHYRKIPSTNVVHLKGVSPTREMFGFIEYRERILKPILKAISGRKIGDQIDYIVYSSGFPTAVNVANHQKKLIAELKRQTGGAIRNARLLTPRVSINSLTYFFRKAVVNDPTYIGLNTNRYARASCANMLRRPFLGPDQKLFASALSDYQAERWIECANILEKLATKHPAQVAVSYWLARCYARGGDPVAATSWLRRATAAGWEYRRYVETDVAFDGVRNDKAFSELVKQIPDHPFEWVPTRAFRSKYFWGPNSMINGTRDAGENYVLSTMLAVTRGKGLSEQQALDYLTRSIQADSTHPQGKFYFAHTGDIRSKVRRERFPATIDELAKLGFAGEIVRAQLPKNKKDILGVTLGTAKFNWAYTNNTIVPGGIGENLTSFGGMLDGTQTKLFEFLKGGAAGSSGTVIEPYAEPAKFPDPRIYVHYVKGCTLAEAFYQSVRGPFHLLIVGDALCQPFATRPTLEIKSAFDPKHPKKRMSFFIDASKSPVPIGRLQLFLDGRLAKSMRPISVLNVDTATWTDGYHELRLVAVADSPVEQQNSYAFDLNINNAGGQVDIKTESTEIEYGGKFGVSLNAPGAKEITVLHGSREIGKLEAESGTVDIDTTVVGRGPVSLHAVGVIAGKKVSSVPLKVNINGEISALLPEPKPKK